MGEASPHALAHTGWVLAGTIAAAASLRTLVSEALPAECARRADVELVAGELAVNAATHSRARTAGGFAAELTVMADHVELAVHDPGGAEQPRLIEVPNTLADPNLPAEAFEHGRGLVLVDAHADSWGHTGDDNGRVVWACFDLPETSPRPGAHTNDPHAEHAERRQASSDFPGPGGVTQPPENVLTDLLGPN